MIVCMRTAFVTAVLFLGVLFATHTTLFAATIAPGCRPATAEDNAQLAARGLPPSAQICPQDEQLLGVGKDFEQWYAQLKTQSPCNKNTCNLACKTRNTGAQVCGTTSKKWGSIGCHPNNNTAIFPTVAHGFAAHIELLKRFCAERNRCTIGSVIQQWTAIAADRPAYINFVSKNAGIPSNQVFNPNDIDVVARLALSMACFEGGAMPFPVDQLKQGLVMAGGGAQVPVPANVGQLLNESLYGSGVAGTINRATGGALGNSPLGQFLGLQPSGTSSSGSGSQTPINGVTGGSARAPSYASTTPVSTSTPSSVLSRSTPAGTATTGGSTTGTTPVSLPLTEAALQQAQGVATSASGVNTTNPAAPIATLKDTPPTLLCVPGVVEQDEPALLFWSCNDESTSAEVDADTDEQCETFGNTSGVMCAHPTKTTTYTLTCSAGTSAQCLIEVISPTIALISTPRSIVRGGTVDISWSTQDAENCVLKSNALPSYVRTGVTGDVVSHTMLADTTFTLVCETRTGTIRQKEVVVEVI